VVQFSRLRRGEIIATLSAVVLVALVFGVSWFSFANPGGGHTHADAWTSLPVLRWPILVTAALGLLLGWLQATRSAPALPVALDVPLLTLAAITTVALLIRVLTGEGSPLAGAILGLVATAVLTAGAFMSLREEQRWNPSPPNPEHPVETVELSQIRGQH
jgi:cytochrome bd-type quinol oxidase subunit 2